MISRSRPDWEGRAFYPLQRTYLCVPSSEQKFVVSAASLAKARKRGPVKGGNTLRAKAGLRKLDALGLK